MSICEERRSENQKYYVNADWGVDMDQRGSDEH